MKRLGSIVLLFLIPVISFSNDTKVLSNTKQEIINLKEKQIKEKEQYNKYDWVSDIDLNISVTRDEDDTNTKDSYLSISQDIFRFGGISSQIEYASQLKKMENLDLRISTKDDLNTLFTYLIDIKINDINLKQNVLNIQNSEIEIRNKKSEYNAGELGISDLNDAIMTKNGLSDEQKELALSKLVNINNIKKYTDENYKTIKIPNAKLMNKDIYLKNATSINYAKLDVEVNNSLYKIKKSDYLPSLAVTGQYGYQDTNTDSGDDYYSYGLEVSMPLSYTASNDIEQTRLDHLISKKELTDELISSSSTYEEAVLTIKNYEDRIKLALEDIKLYDELLNVNEEEYKAGYKTIDDVETIENSKMIRTLDIELYKLNIQKQILSLYFEV